MRKPGMMHAAGAAPRITSLAPQLLVDDLSRSIAYYERIGFTFPPPWRGVYAIGTRDGFELHLKLAPRSDDERRHRRAHDHLDAAAGVDGIEEFYERCVTAGAMIFRPLAPTAWGTRDFYLEDPDGNIVAFGGAAAEANTRPVVPGAVPELPVAALGESIQYYRDHLGFTLDWGGGDGGIAGVSRGSCRLFLTERAFREHRGNAAPVVVWLNVNSREEVDAFHEALRASAARIVSVPEAKPWKLYEFTVADVDGNLFRVFYDFAWEAGGR